MSDDDKKFCQYLTLFKSPPQPRLTDQEYFADWDYYSPARPHPESYAGLKAQAEDYERVLRIVISQGGVMASLAQRIIANHKVDK